MIWDIEFTAKADRQLEKLGPVVKARIRRDLETKVATLENPRSRAVKLKYGKKAGLWRFRVGRYRAICEVQDKLLRILVVEVAKRDKAYPLDRYVPGFTVSLSAVDLEGEFDEEAEAVPTAQATQG